MSRNVSHVGSSSSSSSLQTNSSLFLCDCMTMMMDDNNLRLPLAKIRPMIKLDPDVQLTSQDSVYLIAKATEMFIEFLAQESFRITLANKRKIVTKQDLEEAVDITDPLHFLQEGSGAGVFHNNDNQEQN